MSALDVILRAKRGLWRLAEHQAKNCPHGKKREREQRLRREAHELLRFEIEAGQG